MPSFGSQPLVTRPELVRWSLCAAVVVAAHGLVALALGGRSDDADVAADVPVVMVELAPITAAPPAPPSDLAVGPLLETEAQERVAEQAPPERQAAPKEETVQEPPAPDPEVAMAPVEPPPEEGPVMVDPPAAAAPVPTAPPTAPTPAPQPTSAAILRWERLLVAQLERHKRYPPQARGQIGEARLAFSIDRTGHVVASHIVHSSGSEALDQEALALVKRAAPLPPPPAGVPEDRLSFVVPIRYH